MTDTDALLSAIKRKGMTEQNVATHLGLAHQCFSLKLNNQIEFKASEIIKLCNLLNITDDIFFSEDKPVSSK